MRLDDACRALQALDFPARGELAHPDLPTVRAARSQIESAVIDDGFLADCIALELRRLERNDIRPGLTPFLKLPNSGIRFAFGYWPGVPPGGQ